MPSHNPVLCDQPPQDQQQAQVKVCASCQSTLTDTSSSVFLPQVDAVVCTSCRDHVLSTRAPSDPRTLCIDTASNFSSFQSNRHTPDSPLFDDEMLLDSPGPSYQDSLITPLTYSPKPSSLAIHCDTNKRPAAPQHTHTLIPTTSSPYRQTHASSSPSPLTDITRLRVRSQAHHCLHPGATFQGTQKSGRNSYDVTVTIVVCCFAQTSQQNVL